MKRPVPSPRHTTFAVWTWIAALACAPACSSLSSDDAGGTGGSGGAGASGGSGSGDGSGSGSGSSGGDVVLDCDAVCEAQGACSESGAPDPECVAECPTIVGRLDTGFQERLEACFLEGECGEDLEQRCFLAAAEDCPQDVSLLKEAVCAHFHRCNPTLSRSCDREVDEILGRSEEVAILACLSDAAFDAAVSCIGGAECGRGTRPVLGCLQAAIGQPDRDDASASSGTGSDEFE